MAVQSNNSAHLKKSLSFFDAMFYGVGVIIGAGIYALIGEASGIAGNATWLSFVIASIVAGFTAMSYAELSSVFPKTAAEFVFVKHAFGSNFLAFFASYSAILANIFSISVVALGFAGYFNGLFGFPIIGSAIGLIMLVSFINYIGIKESAKFNFFATLIESLGIILIIFFGLGYIGKVDLLEIPPNTDFVPSILSAASLIFFAFVGFEQIANISEETKKASKNIPKAVLFSLAFSTLLYCLVAISVVNIMPWQELSKKANPLAAVAEQSFGPNASLLLSIIGIFATSNTVLVLILVASRMLFGLSKQHELPQNFQTLERKTNSPYIAILFVMIVSIALLFIDDIKKIALLSNYFIFVMFALVNLSAIAYRLKYAPSKEHFRMPLNLGKIPLLSVFGFISCLIMLLQMFEPLVLFGFSLPLIFYGLILSLASFPIHLFFSRKN
jgi:APA family basic amino acid/polyamine antiporter